MWKIITTSDRHWADINFDHTINIKKLNIFLEQIIRLIFVILSLPIIRSRWKSWRWWKWRRRCRHWVGGTHPWWCISTTPSSNRWSCSLSSTNWIMYIWLSSIQIGPIMFKRDILPCLSLSTRLLTSSISKINFWFMAMKIPMEFLTTCWQALCWTLHEAMSSYTSVTTAIYNQVLTEWHGESDKLTERK